MLQLWESHTAPLKLHSWPLGAPQIAFPLSTCGYKRATHFSGLPGWPLWSFPQHTSLFHPPLTRRTHVRHVCSRFFFSFFFAAFCAVNSFPSFWAAFSLISPEQTAVPLAWRESRCLAQGTWWSQTLVCSTRGSTCVLLTNRGLVFVGLLRDVL